MLNWYRKYLFSLYIDFTYYMLHWWHSNNGWDSSWQNNLITNFISSFSLVFLSRKVAHLPWKVSPRSRMNLKSQLLSRKVLKMDILTSTSPWQTLICWGRLWNTIESSRIWSQIMIILSIFSLVLKMPENRWHPQIACVIQPTVQNTEIVQFTVT